MADRWTVEDPIEKSERYEWRLPNNEDQHGEQTTAPGDLLIKPGDLELVPTLSPKRSGVQFGADAWNFTSVPDTNWYVLGSISD